MNPFTSGFHLQTDPINNGVVFTFPNKFSLSVRWGYMNYCSNRMHSDNSLTCQNAEVAIIRPDGSIVNDVVGYVSPTNLLLWLTQTANMKETTGVNTGDSVVCSDCCSSPGVPVNKDNYPDGFTCDNCGETYDNCL